MIEYDITIYLVTHSAFEVNETVVAVNTFKATSYEVACAYASFLSDSMGQYYGFEDKDDFFSASVEQSWLRGY